MSWLYDLWHWGTTEIPSIFKQFVQDVVGAGLNLVNHAISEFIFAVAASLDLVNKGLSNLGNIVDGTFNLIWHSITVTLPQAVSDALSFAEGLINDAWGGILALASRLEQYAHDLWNGISSLGDWVTNHVLYPLALDIINLGSQIVTGIRDAVDAFNRDVVQPIWQGLQDVNRWIGDAEQWLENHAYGAVALVEAAASWLVWFAANPLGATEDAFRQLLHGGYEAELLQWSKGEFGRFESLADEVAQWLA